MGIGLAQEERSSPTWCGPQRQLLTTYTAGWVRVLRSSNHRTWTGETISTMLKEHIKRKNYEATIRLAVLIAYRPASDRVKFPHLSAGFSVITGYLIAHKVKNSKEAILPAKYTVPFCGVPVEPAQPYSIQFFPERS